METQFALPRLGIHCSVRVVAPYNPRQEQSNHNQEADEEAQKIDFHPIVRT